MAVGETQVDEAPADEDDEFEARVGWRYTVAKIKRDTTARWGLYIVGFVLLLGAFVTVDANLSRLTFGSVSDYRLAELIPIFDHPTEIPSPHDETRPDRNMAPAFHPDGSWSYPLGTDNHRRDYFTRIVYGSRVSVTVGIVATAISLVGGTIVGAVAGFYGGWIDDVLMRLVEIIYAIPPLILIIVFTVFITGNNPDITYAVVGVGLAYMPVFARIIRSEVLSVREMDYIEAARASGVKDRFIILRHIVPNSFAPVLVYATLQIGITILVVAGLSFLGYGAQPPTPDWGQMLSDAHGQMHSNVWMSVWPGLAIMITIMGFNLFGDGLQDALDPRIKD